MDAYGRQIRDALSGSVYNNAVPLVQGSNELFCFYENEYLPRAGDIFSLVIFGHTQGIDLDALIKETGLGLSPSEPLTFRQENPLWAIFENGLDQIDTLLESAEEADILHLDEDEIAQTRRLLNSEYFKPDQWAENLDALNPIISSRHMTRIPRHVRLRVREVYASFVYGNWLSVLSSGRALLEYALLDRHSPLGFDAYKEDRGQSPKPLSLQRIIDNASEKFPELSEYMNLINSCGNEVMHPIKKKKVTNVPAGRNQALDCIVKLRIVLQRLYV